ncbi:MAG: hypothetical protein JXR96_05870 [Deltaproteobacteria bacterium]|nr:hypothetical protein [Deltaproteobacteria bacterium]
MAKRTVVLSILCSVLLGCGGIQTDPCECETCSGRGYCVADMTAPLNSAGGSLCLCDPGFHPEGLACVEDPEPVRDPCEGQDCSGHGRCRIAVDIAISADYAPAECLCDEGFHSQGLACVRNEPADLCQDVDCSGYGRCVVDVAVDSVDGAPAPRCVCDPGYHPENLACVMNDAADPCAAVDCSGRGICMADAVSADAAAAPLCVCDDGSVDGDLACIAQPQDDPCAGVTCSGHGSCALRSADDSPDGSSIECLCERGFHAEGLSCAPNDAADPCQHVDCNGHGECVVVSDQLDAAPECVCQAGYRVEGTSCVPEARNPCEGISCSGHGYCIATVSEGGAGATCVCDPGFHPQGLACVLDACGPANCDGCCDEFMRCQPGDTLDQCGSGGQQCRICGPSDEEIRDNLGKYWHYRNRLRTQFMAVGEGQGYSLPAAWVSGPLREGKLGAITWSDTTSYMGWYLAALATEHYLLSHPEKFPGYAGAQDRREAKRTVENELYYALKAVARLDRRAESVFSESAPDTPGFFIRDDVNERFFRVSGLNERYRHFQSGYQAGGDEMSQDQVIHLLLGLALVKKLVPESLEVDGMNIRRQVVKRSVDMVEWMSARRPCCRDGDPPYECPGAGKLLEECADITISVHDRWLIFNPAREALVARGWCADRHVGGLVKAIRIITDGARDYGPYAHEEHWSKWRCLATDNCMIEGDSIFYNHAMRMALGAIPGRWDRDEDFNSMDILMKHARKKYKGNRNDVFRCGSDPKETPGCCPYYGVEMEVDWYVYPLLNAVLNPEIGGGGGLDKWGEYKKTIYGKVRKMLIGAPAGGPRKAKWPEMVMSGWGTDNRFGRTKQHGICGLKWHADPTFYNGLDYMVLHNAFHIAMPELWR